MATNATQTPVDKIGAATQTAYEAAANAASVGSEFATEAAKAFLPPFEETTERLRQVNEKLLASAKTMGRASLDAYDKALAGALDLENKIASTTQVDWFTTVTAAHTKFVSEVGAAYTAAGREFLK